MLDTGALRLSFRGLSLSVGCSCLLNFLVSSQFKSMAQYLENTDKFFWIRKTRFPDQFLDDIRAMVNSTVAEIIAKLKVTIFICEDILCVTWYDIEDITWPRGDTKFIFDCCIIFHE